MKRFINIFGEEQTFECTGCDIASHRLTPPYGYVYEDDFINISPDPEIPIPGFMILGINKHISSMNDMTDVERNSVMKVLNHTIEVIKKACNVSSITIIQEEEAKHFHIWILPNYEWMNAFGRGCLGMNEKIAYAKSHNDEDNTRKIEEAFFKIKNSFKL